MHSVHHSASNFYSQFPPWLAAPRIAGLLPAKTDSHASEPEAQRFTQADLVEAADRIIAMLAYFHPLENNGDARLVFTRLSTTLFKTLYPDAEKGSSTTPSAAEMRDYVRGVFQEMADRHEAVNRRHEAMHQEIVANRAKRRAEYEARLANQPEGKVRVITIQPNNSGEFDHA